MEEFISMDLWQKFKLAELDQLMQQDDRGFANLLNKIRAGENDHSVEQVIKSLFLDKNDQSNPNNIFHTFAENIPVKRHNDNQLKQIPGQLITIPAKNEVHTNFRVSDAREAQNRKQSDTSGLASLLKLKINAKVMFTTSIN